MSFDLLNLIFDFVLLGMAAFAAYLIMGYGGIVGRAFNIIAWGTVFVGVANFASQFFAASLDFSPEQMGFIQRTIVFAGLAFVVIGFRILFKRK